MSALADRLAALNARPQLRLITCGSVDDGKSSLIGHLLYLTGNVADDQLARWRADCARLHGSVALPDFSLLLDGLNAEREQGITIDVAWRYFGTPHARFVVADCPGHEQYTRNMATGASQCEAAIVLVDARRGIKPQTRRHSAIATLFGIRALVLAVNKCDLIDFDRQHFEAISAEYTQMARALGAEQVIAIPLAATSGDNLVAPSPRTPWYQGPSLIDALHQLAHAPAPERTSGSCFAVQAVHRAGLEGRLLAGVMQAGALKRGARVIGLPDGHPAQVTALYTAGQPAEQLETGAAGSVKLDRELDLGRGALLCAPDAPLARANRLEAMLLWMDEAALLCGRSFELRAGFQSVAARVQQIGPALDIDSGATRAVEQLEQNALGQVTLHLDAALRLETDPKRPRGAAFILVDRLSRQTVAAGIAQRAHWVESELHWQALNVDQQARAAIKGQRPRCLWFTGLSGAGKSSIANEVEKRLLAAGAHTYLLDGDNVRHGLNRDLGFSAADRIENVRRAAEVARLMVDAGLIVLVSFISPFRAERAFARALFKPGEFIEVYVDTPLEVAEARDVKGLYKRARAGLIPNFTGIGSPYEAPLQPEIHLYTPTSTVHKLADEVVAALRSR